MRPLLRRSRHLVLLLASAVTLASVVAPIATADTTGSGGSSVKMTSGQCETLYNQYMSQVFDAAGYASQNPPNWNMAQTALNRANKTRDLAASGGCYWIRTVSPPPKLIVPRVGGVTLAL